MKLSASSSPPKEEGSLCATFAKLSLEQQQQQQRRKGAAPQPPSALGRFQLLPDELTLHVLSFLHAAPDVCAMSLLNHHWHDFTQEQALWKRLFQEKYPAAMWMGSVPTRTPAVGWKRTFQRYCKLADHWRKGSCALRTFADPLDHSIRCVRLASEETAIVAGGNEVGHVSLWDLQSRKESEPASRSSLLSSFQAHSGLVRCVRFFDSDTKLATCSSDKAINIYSLSLAQLRSDSSSKERNGVTLLQTMPNDIHQGLEGVWTIQVEGNQLVSGCEETIAFWDLETHQCNRQVQVRLSRCFHLQGDRLVVGLQNGIVLEYDQRTLRPVRRFRAFNNPIWCLQVSSSADRIVVGGGHIQIGNLTVWDNARLRYSQAEHTGSVRELQFDDTKLVSGSRDCTIRIWNLEEQASESLSHYILREKGQVEATQHTDRIRSLHCSARWIASGSWDKTVKVWDFAEEFAL
ncbi:F-box/WD repeat-containing protein 9 [Balamuthia mandrillaris]